MILREMNMASCRDVLLGEYDMNREMCFAELMSRLASDRSGGEFLRETTPD